MTPLLAWLSAGTWPAWSSGDALLGWPFINPLILPAGARLWMMLPLVACVAVVYRATRAQRARDLPRATAFTFFSIVLGMALIAIAFYLLDAAARLWL